MNCHIEILCLVGMPRNIDLSNNLEITGERFLPWMEGAEHHYEHIHRYTLASNLVKGKKVLDLACGEGYGSQILSKEARFVIGVEIDQKTVKHAHNKYTSHNLEFIRGSILDVPIQGDENFDVIVCFEAIEHVENHEKLLGEVKRLLNNNGVFIVSSPNKKTYTNKPDIINPFHVKELYFNEFRDLLTKYFNHQIFLGQKVYAISSIWPLAPSRYVNYNDFLIEKRGTEYYSSKIDKKDAKYFIAIVSDNKLEQEYFITSNLFDVSNSLIEDFEKSTFELNNSLQMRNNQIAELNSHIAELNSHIAELSSRNVELNGILQSIQESIVWQFLMKYQNGFVEKLLPRETNRRRRYDALLLCIRNIITKKNSIYPLGERRT